MKRIGYCSEPVEAYSKGLSACKDVESLRLFLSDYRLIADDALDIANLMTDKDWAFYHKGLKSERRGVFAGEEWAAKYSVILMPAVLFNVGIIAHRFAVPWGCAYIRCREHGMVAEHDGIAIWKGHGTKGN